VFDGNGKIRLFTRYGSGIEMLASDIGCRQSTWFCSRAHKEPPGHLVQGFVFRRWFPASVYRLAGRAQPFSSSRIARLQSAVDALGARGHYQVMQRRCRLEPSSLTFS
jgi:hypothetical protein